MVTPKIKIYEVKTGSAENAKKLFSPEGKYFYWNNAQFLSNDIGDLVFIVNKTARWALFAKIGAKDITTRQDRTAKTASFNHDYNSYTVSDVDGVYNIFIRFDIVSKLDINQEWNWTKQLGQSEIFDLLRDGLKDKQDRISKVDDLEKIFTEGEAFETLEICRDFLSKTENELFKEIIESAKSKDIQDFLALQEFYYDLAIKKFKELNDFKVDNHDDFYNNLINIEVTETKFDKIVARFEQNSKERILLQIIGELIAYCDVNAAHKKEYNKTEDFRVLARSFVRQNDWVHHLLLYKQGKNNLESISALAIKNAMLYLSNPNEGITMLSENHRQMVAKYLLNEDYEKDTFINKLVDFFKPYNLNPVNTLNLTLIIGRILYRFPAVKQLWFERVEGLVAQDTTDWFESALDDIQSTGKIVLWWSRVPTARNKVDKLLNEQIKNNGYYYLFYSQNNQAVYRARVIDHAYENTYSDKKWNTNNDVEWYKDNFSEYKDDDTKKASIAFLVDEFIKLQEPIPIDKFEFYTGEAPRQINLQPFTELDWELESEPKIWFVTQGATFREEKGMKFLWAPEKGKDGNGRFYWDNVLKVKKGDIIFNYSEGELKGVSIATNNGYPSENKDAQTPWGPNGFRVDIQLTNIEPSLKSEVFSRNIALFNRHLNIVKNKPFSSNGSINQGYLYEFTKEAGRYLRDLYGKPFGNKTIDEFFDKVKLTEQPPVIVNTMDFNNIYRKEICAIKTKPFLLMAGISGTGKSRMVRTLAYKTCPSILQENDQPGNFINISVKPNWHDSTELIGYVSRIPEMHYVVTDFIRFIIKAWKNLNTPFFLCLDEMNLAPVEQYFAEYLSKIESRQKNNNKVVTDAIISKELFSEFFKDLEISLDVDPELHMQFINEGIGLPPNLVVIGTVNMDETTHSFSRKVLDRAMTFEKNLKNEEGLFDLAEQDENDWTFLNQMESSSFLANEIKPAEILSRFNEKQLVVDRLNAINNILKNSPFMVAYRTLDEALMYVYFNSICEPKPTNWFDIAFDEIIMMKLLPRIEGDEIKTAVVLSNLETQLVSFNATKSLAKCRLMIERLKSGYTSYWN